MNTNDIITALLATLPVQGIGTWLWWRWVNSRWNKALEQMGVNAEKFRQSLQRMKEEEKERARRKKAGQ